MIVFVYVVIIWVYPKWTILQVYVEKRMLLFNIYMYNIKKPNMTFFMIFIQTAKNSHRRVTPLTWYYELTQKYKTRSIPWYTAWFWWFLWHQYFLSKPAFQSNCYWFVQKMLPGISFTKKMKKDTQNFAYCIELWPLSWNHTSTTTLGKIKIKIILACNNNIIFWMLYVR